jgi:hypothetical protein
MIHLLEGNAVFPSDGIVVGCRGNRGYALQDGLGLGAAAADGKRVLG